MDVFRQNREFLPVFRPETETVPEQKLQGINDISQKRKTIRKKSGNETAHDLLYDSPDPSGKNLACGFPGNRMNRYDKI